MNRLYFGTEAQSLSRVFISSFLTISRFIAMHIISVAYSEERLFLVLFMIRFIQLKLLSTLAEEIGIVFWSFTNLQEIRTMIFMEVMFSTPVGDHFLIVTSKKNTLKCLRGAHTNNATYRISFRWLKIQTLSTLSRFLNLPLRTNQSDASPDSLLSYKK